MSKRDFDILRNFVTSYGSPKIQCAAIQAVENLAQEIEDLKEKIEMMGGKA